VRLDVLLEFRSHCIDPGHCRRRLTREIEYRRELLLQLIGSHLGQRPAVIENQGGAQPLAGVSVGADRIRGAPHPDLQMIAEVKMPPPPPLISTTIRFASNVSG
jgi:hypothetical protein